MQHDIRCFILHLPKNVLMIHHFLNFPYRGKISSFKYIHLGGQVTVDMHDNNLFR